MLVNTVPHLFSRSRTVLQYNAFVYGKTKGGRFFSAAGATDVKALIFGKPGGGKGTISGKILADFPTFHHLSTGDVLRQHVREQSEIGVEAKKHMDQGHLVPDELMIRLVIQDTVEHQGSLLLDGFPRTIEQAKALDDALNVDLVINLDIPTDTIVERISDRWIHPASGRIYSYSYKPPKNKGVDDETGEPLVQRDDDKPDRVRTRLESYDKVTSPLIDFYTEKGVLETFQGTKSDVIYVDVKKWLTEKLASAN
mmetsp:Transcript_46329/g.68367  ORF Transcript_46329/g.68367 Transcript_46329/m.68367 type:complete len:254 (+) Transcript_46329:97-858(+)|eukprot:CAMPEP_0195531748 /NCGR_PEP_ID=MMETSP0794_2-20130614/36225_1 /TAXON_ID=515487 /ORGANISM="Stephanopyxis turris, Strain CCMP 815" /LENGTH=253 /DNA_ID=CAMNT_0040663663 /DNA_START=75 /DNA_END=836 /DNA_ORIENTATION=+